MCIRDRHVHRADDQAPEAQNGGDLDRAKACLLYTSPSEVVGNGHTRKDGIKRGWNRNTVKRILQNVTYLGWVSNGNTKKVNYKSKKTMIMPKEDRIIKKGMHTPCLLYTSRCV